MVIFICYAIILQIGEQNFCDLISSLKEWLQTLYELMWKLTFILFIH